MLQVHTLYSSDIYFSLLVGSFFIFRFWLYVLLFLEVGCLGEGCMKGFAFVKQRKWTH